MNFDNYFRLISYGFIASAFSGLALTGELYAIPTTLYGLAFTFCFYADTKGATRFRLREWMWRLLTALYIPFMIVDATIFTNRVMALVHLSLFASAAKLFQNKTDRDWIFLYLIAFFQMLLASGLTFNATFIASLMAFLFFFISTLAAFEIRRTRRSVAMSQEEVILRSKPAWFGNTHAKNEEASGSSATQRVRRVRYLLGASLAQSLIILALALPFFFMIPRFGSGNLASNFGENKTLTGFSENVELGKVAEIKQSTRAVMRVELNNKPSRYIRWRGVALEHYNGKAWSLNLSALKNNRYSQSTGGQKSNSEDPQVDLNSKQVHPLQSSAYEEPLKDELLVQTITLEPLNTGTIFASRTAKSLLIQLRNVRQDKLTNALSSLELKGRNYYTVTSNINVPSEDDLRNHNANDYHEDIRTLYLQKPEVPKDKIQFDPRIRKLAQEVTVGAKNNYDKARAIEKYLKTEFHYSLDLKIGSDDPLSEFLFNVKEGHCEYFATAMVMMMRSIGIPARIVNGFQMGEYNSFNDRYTVRESDAHSWVEVYFLPSTTGLDAERGVSSAQKNSDFPAKGKWVEFDPTPSSGLNDYSQGGLRASLRKYMDAMEVFWLDYVVTLDREEQASLMVEIQHRLLDFKNQALAYSKAAKAWITQKVFSFFDTKNWTSRDFIKFGSGVGLLGVLLFGLYISVAYLKRRNLKPTGYNPWWYRVFILPILRRIKRRKRDHRASAVLFYEQMLAISARAGLKKAPEQTPLEFASASGYSQIRELTAVYNRVRFGKAMLNEDETRKVSGLLAELKRTIAKR
jgi:transglutaminase-like putative cysteine protease